MTEQLLICTDLDRTLIPNGPQAESVDARKRFHALISRPEVSLAYVSGRHKALIEKAINSYQLPLPDFVIGDVGTTIYRVKSEKDWQRLTDWEDEISPDWNGMKSSDLIQLLKNVFELKLQETEKQNHYKLSFYVPLHSDRNTLTEKIQRRLSEEHIHASLIWSEDEAEKIGLLDILPASASKFHAIQALIKLHEYDIQHTIFCGDSGNDLEVLASPIFSVLVANSQPEIKQQAEILAKQAGNENKLYIAQGGFKKMNGNYSAGMLEGIAHYYSHTANWMTVKTSDTGS